MNSEPSVKLRIRELRARQADMSQSELARLSGLSKATISNLESGRLRRIELETIGKLCRALACTPDDLFELPSLTETELIQRQKHALSSLLGTIRYDKPFDVDELDIDLVAITDRELNAPLRVAEATEHKPARRGKKR